MGFGTWTMNTSRGRVSRRKRERMAVNVVSKETATTTVREKQKQIRYDLISFVELPEYMKDNEYILRYYRAEWPLKEAFFSLFRWHNETLNIWTHLLGFVLFLGLTVVNWREVPRLGDFLSIFSRRSIQI